MFFDEKELENSKVEHDEVDDVDVSDPLKQTIVNCESEHDGECQHHKHCLVSSIPRTLKVASDSQL